MTLFFNLTSWLSFVFTIPEHRRDVHDTLRNPDLRSNHCALTGYGNHPHGNLHNLVHRLGNASQNPDRC